MAPLRWAALLLSALLRVRDCSGSSVHTSRNFYTAVWEPHEGRPHFVAVNYVDGQCYEHYDSDTRRERPAASWMERVTEEDPHYWDQQTNILRDWEAAIRANMAILRERYNQSGGLHTLQIMYGCDLSGDVPGRGYEQYSYDGRDFLAFDKETLSWTAADAAAQITKRKWEAEPAIAQRLTNYLEEECIEWLKRYLRYGNRTLLRTDPPVLRVTYKGHGDGMETLLCQTHGFYPKEIDIAWKKDGEVRQEGTHHGVVSPNADGTYYTWLSIEIDSKERSRYQCHVDHDGLQDPLDLNVEESGSVWLIAVGIAAVIFLFIIGIFMCCYFKKRPEKHPEKRQEKPEEPSGTHAEKLLSGSTSANVQGSDCSSKDSQSPLIV